ncbi:MAG TPA: hypothetical protein VEJ23_03740 [Solirubrobacteraceae bacterium]|nr:hypothetical protein [Solirubrobacteraceae bacterium]
MPAPDAATGRDMPTIDELVIADEPARWAALGFTLDGDVCQLGQVRVRLAGPSAGRGIVGWSLRDIVPGPLDGLAPTPSLTHVPVQVSPHPNGIAAIDHVVAVSPDLQRTVSALTAAGLPLRRIRERPSATGAPRQAFFRLGDEILEVVQDPSGTSPPDRPAHLWGLALLANDLEGTVASLGDRVSETRPAVQPGRRIATVRPSAGLSVPMALISRRRGT